jgi:DNA-binding PadR family transcriptional regulator
MDTANSRMTTSTCSVLAAFLRSPGAELYGKQIMQLTGISSGTLYPILRRQVERGCLTLRLEGREESNGDRPLRKYYRLTSEGEELARRVRLVLPELLDQEN